jgi:hypothetical protein
MPLASVCAELDEIALLTRAELQVIRCMRRNGEAPEPEAEARCLAAGIAQIALMITPLQMECLALETAAALTEA